MLRRLAAIAVVAVAFALPAIAGAQSATAPPHPRPTPGARRSPIPGVGPRPPHHDHGSTNVQPTVVIDASAYLASPRPVPKATNATHMSPYPGQDVFSTTSTDNH